MKKSMMFLSVLAFLIFGFINFAYCLIDFVDKNNGWVIVEDKLGNAFLAHTTDSGQNWKEQKISKNEYYMSMDFVDSKNGWVASATGKIYYTADGGDTWAVQMNLGEMLDMTSDTTMFRCSFVDTNNGWAIGTDFYKSIFARTIDGGKKWTIIENAENKIYTDIKFVNSTEGWLAGARIEVKGLKSEIHGVISHTTNSGDIWEIQKEEIGHIFNSMFFINSKDGWMADTNWGTGSYFLLQTLDGGKTWTPKTELDADYYRYFFTNSQEGWMVGYGGILLHTADGGKTWSKNDTGFDVLSFSSDIFFIDPNEGWVVFNDIFGEGFIVHTLDGGTTWKKQYPQPPIPEVASVNVSEGSEVAGNAAIMVKFNVNMQSVTINVSGMTGTTQIDPDDSKLATWTPSPNMPSGSHTLTITGKDEIGRDLEPFKPITFIAIPPDLDPPVIDNAKCNPKNGDNNIDPQKISKITIAFSEKLKNAKVDSIQPFDMKSDSKFDGDREIDITLFSELKNNATFRAILTAEDVAGNKSVSLEYSFTTISETYEYTISLQKGLNFVSLPLNPAKPYNARSFAEKLGATVVIRYDEVAQKFDGFTLTSSNDGFLIEGGKGYIVNVPMGGFTKFEGTAWMDAAPVDSPITNQDIWAFVASGTLIKDNESDDFQKYTVIVKNLTTGSETTANVDKKGYFAGVWADLSRKSVIRAGDKIEVSAIDNNKNVVSGGFIKQITDYELKNAVLDIKLKIGDIIPPKSQLLQNYPNPFNPETWVPFQLKEDSNVQIQIFDMSGHLVRRLDLGHRSAGVYIHRDKAAYWDGRNEAGERVSSGIYFYNILAGKLIATKKMIIMQ